MIHYYAYPLDDTCLRITPLVTASPEDPGYPAVNLVLENPAHPAKLTATTGEFVVQFAEPTQVAAAVILYHNIEQGNSITLQGNDSDSWGAPAVQRSFSLLGKREDNWTVSPWIELPEPATYQFWRLVIEGSANVNPISIGRLMLLTRLRVMKTDVRWGEEEAEEHDIIELPTEAGVETIYSLGGKRRMFNGEITLSNPESTEFVALARQAHGRIYSWLLIPEASINDAWIVRFVENRWSRVRETVDVNNFPFQVKELSRGLPWP
jgi:hypothetical protein